MKRKYWLLGLAIFLLPLIILFLYLLINCFIPKVNTYYIPQIDMYIKTKHILWKKEGYILLGKDSNLQINKSTDYLKVTAKPSGDSFIIDNINKTIYIIDRYTSLKEVNSVIFQFTKLTNAVDTLYLNHNNSVSHQQGLDTFFIPITNNRDTFWMESDGKNMILKHPYLFFSVGDYFQPPISIFYYDNKYKIYPIKNK